MNARTLITLAPYRRTHSLRKFTLVVLFPGLLLTTGPVSANPRGGVVVHGDINIENRGAGHLQITQNSRNAIINWDDFSIGRGELTRFVQPNSNAAVLNRVTGGDPSSIQGALRANGNVFVINPNGILIGSEGTIDVHGLVLSTLDVANGEFLAGADMVFEGNSKEGITNLGRINAIGGDVFLIGRTISNSGSISASEGRVGLAAGQEVLLAAKENAKGERMFVRAKGSGVSGTGIFNDGTIEGAAIELKAHGNIYAMAINNKGSIRATDVSRSGGRVFLNAPGGSVTNTGAIRSISPGAGRSASILISAAYARVDGMLAASGESGGNVRISATEKIEVGAEIDVAGSVGNGGSIVVEGRDVEIGSTALMDASGATGGGSIRIGGGFQGNDADVLNSRTTTVHSGSRLIADGKESGAGGTVVLWSDGDTLFSGDISAQGISAGGFVEVSGHDRLGFDGAVSTMASSGVAGVLLLDPTDGIVSTATQNLAGSPFIINSTSLGTSLGSNNVVISTPSTGSDRGTITFNNSVTWNSANSLSVLAHGDVYFNVNVQNGGAGAVNVVAGWDGTTGLPVSSPLQNPGTVIISDFLNNTASYGNQQNGINGSIYLSSDIATNGVAVGSRNGETNLLGYDLTMQASNTATADRYAQIGYRDVSTGVVSPGSIHIQLANTLTMTAGNAAVRNYVQIGHGGADGSTTTGAGDLSGDIRIAADNGIFLNGGSGSTQNYAQIGHGGFQSSVADSVHGGSITVSSTNGGVTATAGEGTDNYVQIGHGGRLARGQHGGEINVSAKDDIAFSGSSAARGYAQIGHGGHDADQGGGVTNKSGNIFVESTDGNTLFNAGPGSGVEAYAQLGHGGVNTSGDHSGSISVIGGAISFSAGGATDTYAQLGHGGRNARGDHSGAITVTAVDDITFTGGTASQTFAMLGHGGRDADNPNPGYYPDNDPLTLERGPTEAERIGNSGNISVTTTGGDVRFTSGSATESWVILGHGGAYTDGDHVGNITVNAAGDIVFDASDPTGAIHFAQLGHGGYLTSGGQTGNLTVTAGNDIIFTAGPSSSYAHLGHGGRNDHRVNRGGTSGNYVQNNANDRYYPGTHTGDISVSAGRDIAFTGGTGGAAYAQIGHGGFRNDAEAGEGHNGNISVIGDGAVSFSAGSGGQTYAQVGHGGYEAYGNHGYQVVRSEVGSVSATQAGSAILANGALAAGSIKITVDPTGTGAGTAVFTDDGNGNLIDPNDTLGLGANAVVGSADYTTGEITFVENANVAGDSVDVAYLHGGSDILVQGKNGVSFSAGGASQTYTQIGHGGFDADFSLNRNVEPEETAPATNTSSTTFHLNTPQALPVGTSGNIVVRVGYDGAIVTNPNASLTFLAGTGADAFAQLGNGGRATDGDHIGNIIVDATGDILFSGGSNQRTFAQLGNGGHDSDANILTPTKGNTGDIRVNNNLINGAVNAVGSVSFLAGNGEESYAQLGHGGYTNQGANSGIIDLRSGSDITFTSGDGSGIGDLDGTGSAFTPTAGNGRRSYAQLGHGGYDSDAASSGGVDGIGHSGDISVLSGGKISFTASVVTDPTAEDYRNYVLLGHGGLASSGDHSGNITVVSVGNIDFTSGSVRASDPINAPTSFFSMDSFAQLGHGGRDSDGYGTANTVSLSGDIRVEAGGGIHFLSSHEGPLGDTSSANDAYVQLGHGGMNVDGSRVGNVDVVALTGDIVFDATKGGVDGYAQLGHGGRAGRGDHVGDILVDAFGDISFLGGTTLRTYAQLGHGGSDADYNTGDSARIGNSGDILVNTRSGIVTNTGSIYFTGGTGEESYVLLGHGGYGTQGAHSGNLLGLNIIDVRSAGDITFTSGDGSGYGDDTAGSLGNGRRSFAQLGHGGYDSDAASTGGLDGDGHKADINVKAGGSISFTASELNDPVNGPDMQANDFRNYVQLGHGGLASNGDHSGNITVTAGSGISFSAGNVNAASTSFLSQDAYAQLGHGGYASDGYGGADAMSKSGDITVIATGGNIAFNGSNENDAYVLIGHGGRDVDGGATGNVIVSAVQGGITFQAGSGTDNFAQVGHGGRTARGDRSGNIAVTAQDDIQFLAGSGTRTYALIGHGGHDADNPNPTNYPDNDPLTTGRGPTVAERIGNSGDINVTSTGGSIRFIAGSAGEAFAALGHGGAYTDGDQVGNINVNAEGDIVFDASETTGNAHYAQLGHGGYLASGGHTGDILVSSGGEIRFTAGTSTSTSSYSYVQLGHGGRNDHRLTRGGSSGNYSQTNVNDRYYAGTHTGSINVSAGDDITFTSGNGTGAYAQVGHGGFRNAAEAGEGHSGDVSVVSDGFIGFTAQNGNQAYVQIGHGGYEAFGNHGYQVVRTEAGSVSATQAGSTVLANGSLAPGSLFITVDPEAVGAGTAVFTDDGQGNILDSALTVVGSIDYTTGEVIFSTDVNAAGDVVEVAYLHGGSDILVDGGNGVAFSAGSGSTSHAQIGHGGVSSAFSSTLNIQPEETAPASNTSTTTYHLNTPSVNPVGMSGNITVNAGTGSSLNPAASVTFTSGTGNDSYAQIGNGGRAARGDHRGDIDVSAGGDISFTAPFEGTASQTVTNSTTLNNLLQNDASTNYTMAQTGNLDRSTIVITYDNPLAGFTGTIRGDTFGRLFDGDIEVGTVSTGGVINLSVTVSDSSAGPAASVITFDHYNTGVRAYVQIGHGGDEADFPTALTPGSAGNLGNISVVSENGAISFAAGNRNEAYAQIGHGGYATSGDHSGNIVVEALGTNGAITFAAGGRNEAYAQIGHGGRSAKGNFGLVDVDGDGSADGDITAVATGSILFSAGSANQTYAQLGHGGYDADAITTAGNTSNTGNILVESTVGDIIFNAAGSNGINSYVQLGHGGMNTYGDFSGSITARAYDGAVEFTAGEHDDRYAQLGHGGRTAKGDQNGNIDVLGADGVSFTGGGIASVSSESSANLIDAAKSGAGATATLVETANLDLETLVITVSDPVLPEYATITSTAAGVLLDGNNVQVGTVSSAGVVTFTIAVSNQGAASVTVAYEHANYARGYVQLGNGGHDADPTGAGAGTLSQQGDITVASTSGDITFSAGLSSNNYAQLGNGGYGTAGDRSGNIEVNSGGSVILNRGTADDAYVQVGHGARSAAGNSTGNITVQATNGGSVLIQGTGTPVTNATGSRTYGMIGHGGYDANGDHNGNVSVSANGQVLVQGGETTSSFAMIGHGGNLVDGTVGDGNDIILVQAGTGVSVLGGAGNDSYAMIGMGSLGLTAAGNSFQSDIVVSTTQGNIILTGGSSTSVDDSWAQIGNGGGQMISNTQGSIKVRADNGDVILTAGAGQVGTTTQTSNYVQIGNGGHENIGNHGATVDVVSVLAQNIVLNGGSTVDEGYAQIGNGGFGANGDVAGDIQISAAGNVSVNGGMVGREGYAIIGHGGVVDGFLPTNSNFTTGSRSGSILMNIGGTTTLNDQNSIATIGHLGTSGVSPTSNLTWVTGSFDVSSTQRKLTEIMSNMLTGGYVEIATTASDLDVTGNGLFMNTANHIDLVSVGDVKFSTPIQNAGTGDINVIGGWDGATGLLFSFEPSGMPPMAQLTIDADTILGVPGAFGNAGGVVIGDGTQASAMVVGSAQGKTNVVGEFVQLLGSTTAVDGFAQIGFNEERYRIATGIDGVSASGDIQILTHAGGLSLLGGSREGTAAQIGHGGEGTQSSGLGGNIIVDLAQGSAVGDLSIQGGTGIDSFAAIGHGGHRSLGAMSGDIDVVANNIAITGGAANFTSARLGHGGSRSNGNISGAMNIVSLDSVSLSGGSGIYSMSQMGHGGVDFSGNIFSQPIDVAVAGDLSLLGGSLTQAAAQLGHGGPNLSGVLVSGDISVNVDGNILLRGGSGIATYVQIGNGGSSTDIDLGGDIVVSAGNDIFLSSLNSAGGAYAKIGHGDDLDAALKFVSGTGEWNGDITVGAGRNIALTNSMIGHVNAISRATSTSGVTQIGVSRNAPSRQGGGQLVADAESEFSGADELRFYIPWREDNRIAAGALLNGATYSGARRDPSSLQGPEEFTIDIRGDKFLTPNEHGNVFGSGPAPVTAVGYAFYYDTIVLRESATPDGRDPVNPEGPDAGEPDDADDMGSVNVDDDTFEDAQRRRRKAFRGHPFRILYQGFESRDEEGNSTFEYKGHSGEGIESQITPLPEQQTTIEPTIPQSFPE